MAAPTNIDTILRGATEAGEVPGVVALAGTSDGPIYQGAAGTRALPAGPDILVPHAAPTFALSGCSFVGTPTVVAGDGVDCACRPGYDGPGSGVRDQMSDIRDQKA